VTEQLDAPFDRFSGVEVAQVETVEE